MSIEGLRQNVDPTTESHFHGILEAVDNQCHEFLKNLKELKKSVEESHDNEKAVCLEDLFDLLGAKPEDLKEIFYGKIIKVSQKVRSLVAEKEISIPQLNSLNDVLGNSIAGGLGTLNEVIRRISDGRIKSINELSAGKIQLLKNFKQALEDVPYYLDEICEDEEKLKHELTSEGGYLETFERYFDKKEGGKTIMPTGSKKIAYLRMFDEITPENYAELLKDPRIDKALLDEEKMISDLQQNKFAR